jgi:hypothetical protein
VLPVPSGAKSLTKLNFKKPSLSIRGGFFVACFNNIVIIVVMNNDSFQEGFVQTCINRGLNVQQTEDLMKVANYASAFNNKNFRDQFDSQVVKEASADNLSMVAKALLAKSASDKFQS